MKTATPSHILGRHYRSGQAVELTLADGQISKVREFSGEPVGSNILPWLAPGFIDVQSNGYGGQEFSSPQLTPDKVAEIAAVQASFGVSQFCPTVTTASRETMLHALAAIAEACRCFPAVEHTVAGIHVEGPYLSPDDGPRGAHPLEHCRPPDWEEFQQFQEAADGRIRIITLAVEYPQSPAFITRAVASGVVVAIGHTSANSQQIHAAVDAGASLSTHLGNGAHRQLRRHPNYIWDQLAEDRLLASLIVDGHHLPPEVVKTFVRAKSPERCLLVSDISGLAGMPPGRYETALCDLEILADGRLVIAGQQQLLAGASAPIGTGVAHVMRFAEVDLPTAVDMASTRPAQLVGCPVNRLQPGDPADLVRFVLQDEGGASRTARLVVQTTISQGRVVYQAAE